MTGRIKRIKRIKRRSLGAIGMGGALLLATVLAAVADDWRRTPEVPYPSFEYDGRFTFARLRFEPIIWGAGPFTWGLDLKWNHDYPQAEQNFARILDEITLVEANLEGGNILELTDPRLFEHPWAYICEVGFWDPTDEEVAALRTYLLKGGFLVVDDFIDIAGDRAWRNFETQMRRVLPEHRLVPLDISNRVFHAFFPMDSLDLNDPSLPQLNSGIFGIYEENDPTRRLMVVANYNMDVGDYWEWSDVDFYPVGLTQRGFRLGLNYLIYGLTH